MNAPYTPGLALNAPGFVKNAKLVAWVGEIAALCKPDAIHWCDGSQAEYDALCQQLVDAGTFQRLNPAKRPNSFAPTAKKTPAPPTTGSPRLKCATPSTACLMVA